MEISRVSIGESGSKGLATGLEFTKVTPFLWDIGDREAEPPFWEDQVWGSIINSGGSPLTHGSAFLAWKLGGLGSRKRTED